MDRRSKIGLSTLIVFWSFVLLSLAWTKAPREGAIASIRTIPMGAVLPRSSKACLANGVSVSQPRTKKRHLNDLARVTLSAESNEGYGRSQSLAATAALTAIAIVRTRINFIC